MPLVLYCLAHFDRICGLFAAVAAICGFLPPFAVCPGLCLSGQPRPLYKFGPSDGRFGPAWSMLFVCLAAEHIGKLNRCLFSESRS